MKRLLKHTSAALLAFALTSAAPAADPSPVDISVIFKKAHPEAADKEVVVKRIELQPGASAPPHMHPGMITGYVVSGSLEFQLKGEPVQKLKAGDTFFEPPGSHHILAKNPDPSAKTLIIAFVINPKGAPLSVPLRGETGKGH
ncbi:MAG TPA: cupin domain-containing protein [Prosthecobacter sp.]